MAITMNGLKGLAGRITGKSGGMTSDHTTLIMQTVRKLADKEAGKVPLIGHLPVDVGRRRSGTRASEGYRRRATRVSGPWPCARPRSRRGWGSAKGFGLVTPYVFQLQH